MDLIRSIFECQDEFASLGCTVNDMKNCTIVMSEKCPELYEFNHVRNIKLQETTDNLLSEFIENIEKIFCDNERSYCRFHLDYRALSANINGILRNKGYHPVPILTQIMKLNETKNDNNERHENSEVEVLELELEFDKDGRCKNEIWNSLICQEYMNSVGYVDVENLINFKSTRIMIANLLSDKEKKYRNFVAFVSGKEVGHVELYYARNIIYMADLYVQPHFRMQGIASRLIKHAIKVAKSLKCQAIFLDTYSFDTPRYMYTKYGFSDLTESISWIKGKEVEDDMVIMM